MGLEVGGNTGAFAEDLAEAREMRVRGAVMAEAGMVAGAAEGRSIMGS